MYLIFTLVLGLILFILVYAKYVRVVGRVSRRVQKFEIFQKKMNRHIKGLQDANAHLRAEIRLTQNEIERLEKRLEEMTVSSQDLVDLSPPDAETDGASQPEADAETNGASQPEEPEEDKEEDAT
ncbi:MAG: hypothetical protein ACOCVM_04575 [Desulfovibrionaceae bacterium]